MGALALLLWGALTVCAASLGAQTEMSAVGPVGAVLDGTVVDSLTGDPIRGVLVRMDVGDEAITDAAGAFHFEGLPQGKRLMVLLTEDCRVTWAEITVVEGLPRRERFLLPQGFATAERQREEEEQKRRTTGGRKLGIREIDAANASSVMELIRQIAPNMLSPAVGEPGDVSTFRSARGRSLEASDPPIIVIDGVRMPGAEGTLSTMRPSEIAELEVEPGAAAGWEYGSAGASGVIRITLRRGLPDGAVELAEARTECVVPAFPRR